MMQDIDSTYLHMGDAHVLQNGQGIVYITADISYK